MLASSRAVLGAWALRVPAGPGCACAHTRWRERGGGAGGVLGAAPLLGAGGASSVLCVLVPKVRGVPRVLGRAEGWCSTWSPSVGLDASAGGGGS